MVVHGWSHGYDGSAHVEHCMNDELNGVNSFGKVQLTTESAFAVEERLDVASAEVKRNAVKAELALPGFPPDFPFPPDLLPCRFCVQFL